VLIVERGSPPWANECHGPAHFSLSPSLSLSSFFEKWTMDPLMQCDGMLVVLHVHVSPRIGWNGHG